MTRFYRFAALALLVACAAAAQAQPAVANYDTVQAGRFDNGRMFTLDDPPTDYFRETYNFSPSADWYEHARLGALRFATYCSASFVSADGLILTNHHCARQSVTQVGLEDGVDYNEDGFYAQDEDEEKLVEGLFVEQLIDIMDVTAEVNAAADAASGDAARQQARQGAIAAITARMTEEMNDDDVRVQVVTLYSGGQYKAYVYKRYGNIRLVFAPETALGYYGGDPDNFTYPRYALDFSLFRAVDEDGDPIEVDRFFRFNPDGTDPGDLVFVIGNPGSTTRIQTVAQLEYRRDFDEPLLLDAIRTREDAYGAWLAANSDAPEVPEYTDMYFSLGNSRKAYGGRVKGLRDPYLIARRRAAERDFLAAMAAQSGVQAEYGDVVDAIAANRAAARATGNLYGAFVGFRPGSILSSALTQRAILAFQYANSSGEQQAELREAILGIEDQPEMLQEMLLAQRLRDFQAYLGDDASSMLGSRSPQAAARAIMASSALVTMEGAEGLLDGGEVMADPAVAMVAAVMPTMMSYQQSSAASGAELAELETRLALARFALYGTSVPPDATFTLRISDGIVKGYDYNGTVAPPYTTLYGLYDHYYSYCVSGGMMDKCDWMLPERWLEAEDDMDLRTPFDLVSTNDIIGGNSGSPLLDRDLNVVGIAFDGNIEGLPGNYIFVDTHNRTVSVDVRIMLEALDEVYEMDRVVEELRDGGM